MRFNRVASALTDAGRLTPLASPVLGAAFPMGEDWLRAVHRQRGADQPVPHLAVFVPVLDAAGRRLAYAAESREPDGR